MNGDRSEFVAIPLVAGMLGVLFLIFIAAVGGIAWWLALGLGLIFVGAVVTFGLTRWRRRRPEPGDAPLTASKDLDDGIYRVLVVTRGACSSSALGSQLAERAAGRPAEALVVAPVGGSRVARWTGDEDAYADAREQLDVTLAALVALGVEAKGQLGARDPLQAADDGLREFAADEVLFAATPVADGGWLDHGVVERARDRYRVPVTVVVVDPS